MKRDDDGDCVTASVMESKNGGHDVQERKALHLFPCPREVTVSEFTPCMSKICQIGQTRQQQVSASRKMSRSVTAQPLLRQQNAISHGRSRSAIDLPFQKPGGMGVQEPFEALRACNTVTVC